MNQHVKYQWLPGTLLMCSLLSVVLLIFSCKSESVPPIDTSNFNIADNFNPIFNLGNLDILLNDSVDTPFDRIKFDIELINNGPDSSYAFAYIKYDSILVFEQYGFVYWPEKERVEGDTTDPAISVFYLAELDTIDFITLPDSTITYSVKLELKSGEEYEVCQVLSVVCPDDISNEKYCYEGFYGASSCKHILVE